jgi:hypothetical protein
MDERDASAEPRRASAVLDERGAAGAPAEAAQPPAEAAPLADDALIVLPVRNLVLFPATVYPIGVGRELAGGGAGGDTARAADRRAAADQARGRCARRRRAA